MTRARFADVVVDPAGTPIPTATVEVFDAGTTTPVSDTIYDSAAGVGTLANPFQTNAQGEVEFWLAAPRKVDLRYSKDGYITEAHTVDVLDALHGHSGTYAPITGSTVYARKHLTVVRDVPRDLEQSVLASVMATPPTFATSGPGGSSPISGGSPTHIAYNDPRVTLLGCVPVLYSQLTHDYYQNTVNAAWTPAPFAIEFDHYGDDLALKFRNNQASASYQWVWVDGHPATAAPVVSSAASGGSPFYLRITFGTVDYRRIRIWLYQSDFGGIDVKPTQSINPTPTNRPKLGFYGDSFVEGTGGSNALQALSVTVGRLLHWETFVAGQGGTGYVADGGHANKAAYTGAARIAAMVAAAPDYLIIFGSSNDDATSSSTVGAAAASLYASFASALPNCKLIVVGPPSLSSSPGAGRQANRTAIAAAAAAASNVLGFIDPLNDAASTTWVFGSGSSTATAGDGNADYFNNGSVAGHPTQAGHDYYARRIVKELLPLVGAA